MKINLSNHAYKRLTQLRQKGVTKTDVYRAAISFKAKVNGEIKIRNNRAESGKIFEIAIVDKSNCRLVKTVIGLK